MTSDTAPRSRSMRTRALGAAQSICRPPSRKITSYHLSRGAVSSFHCNHRPTDNAIHGDRLTI